MGKSNASERVARLAPFASMGNLYVNREAGFPDFRIDRRIQAFEFSRNPGRLRREPRRAARGSGVHG